MKSGWPEIWTDKPSWFRPVLGGLVFVANLAAAYVGLTPPAFEMPGYGLDPSWGGGAGRSAGAGLAVRARSHFQRRAAVRHLHPLVRARLLRRLSCGAHSVRINRMQSELPIHLSARCGARTRSGRSCRSPAMPNGRCRLHGGLSPGAPRGIRMPSSTDATRPRRSPSAARFGVGARDESPR
jgi:hypothetical protein